jgi:cyclic 2,3-diphosphoglycerate synthetase
MTPARIVVLVDGEHYPPVVASAIAELRAARPADTIAGVALLGGIEKLRGGAPDYGATPVLTGDSALSALLNALDTLRPDVVVDRSDEPVLDARTRLLLASHALARGVRYEGAGFAFDPPPRPRLAAKPSVAVIGTAKRSGKTAVSGAVARISKHLGLDPVVVAMGRGGPLEPEVIDPATFSLTAESLLALAESGRHAASDHLEDALTSGVVTVGTRRCGGGLAGEPGSATFGAGVELANALPGRLLIFEGSGTAIPPVHADATLCVVPATADPELVAGYLGPYPLLLSDGIVLTLVAEPLADSGAVDLLERRIRQLVPGVLVAHTTLRPLPLGPVSGETVFFATTAPSAVAAKLASHLESEYGCTVVGHSANLANRTRLAEDLAAAPAATVLLTELKAAAVDLATRFALERGMHVVYCDNRVVSTGGDVEFEELVNTVTDLATQRFQASP